MTNHSHLANYTKIANIHTSRLQEALTQTMAITSSLTPTKLPSLSSTQVAFLDMLSMRFSKLQYLISGKIFPITQDLLGEDAITFIDKLNKKTLT